MFMNLEGMYLHSSLKWCSQGLDDLTCKMLSKRLFLPSIYSRIQNI